MLQILTRSDYGKLEALLQLVWKGDANQAAAIELAFQNGLGIGAFIGDALIGVHVLALQAVPRPARLVSKCLLVSPSYRGRGVAVSLAMAAAESAIALGVPLIETAGDGHNPDVMGLLVNRLGYVGVAMKTGSRMLFHWRLNSARVRGAIFGQNPALRPLVKLELRIPDTTEIAAFAAQLRGVMAKGAKVIGYRRETADNVYLIGEDA